MTTVFQFPIEFIDRRSVSSWALALRTMGANGKLRRTEGYPTVQAAGTGTDTSDVWSKSGQASRAIGSISYWRARLFWLLPNPASAVDSGRVDSPEATHVSLAAVAERTQPF